MKPGAGTAETRAWTRRARRFWDQRQRLAAPGLLTGYLLEESPPAIGQHRFEGEWAEVQRWMRRYGVGRGRCLDVGCGTGVWLRALAPQFQAVEGWDYAPAMVAASRETLKAAGVSGAKLVCGDITRRPGRAVFDLIFVGGVLMYTPEARLGPLLGALRRLLKPGGLLILRESTRPGGTWAREGQPLRSGLLATAKQKKAQDYVAIYRSREALEAALAGAGLRVKAVRPNVHYKLSDLTEDWLRRLGADPAKAQRLAVWVHGLRWILLYPEYYLRNWPLQNYWFLATT